MGIVTWAYMNSNIYQYVLIVSIIFGKMSKSFTQLYFCVSNKWQSDTIIQTIKSCWIEQIRCGAWYVVISGNDIPSFVEIDFMK